MGTVYRAKDPAMDRVVAIKTIIAVALKSEQESEFRERFYREARAAGGLAHPGIVPVFDVGEHEGVPFLVMEFISGRTLAEAIKKGDRLTPERACEIGQRIAEALGYAHQRGVIHRDITPANILLTDDGTKLPALAKQLADLRKFNEELRTALGVPTFYNEALGSVSQLSVYDRVKGPRHGTEDGGDGSPGRQAGRRGAGSHVRRWVGGASFGTLRCRRTDARNAAGRFPASAAVLAATAGGSPRIAPKSAPPARGTARARPEARCSSSNISR